MSRGGSSTPPESSLMNPLLELFRDVIQTVAYEVPLGRRRIDLLVFEKDPVVWTAVELKVRDWKKALSQAMINHLIADRSFVALWHTSIPLALKNKELFEHYRVGLIEVHATHAEIIFQYAHNEYEHRRYLQRQVTLKRLARISAIEVNDNAPASLLPA